MSKAKVYVGCTLTYSTPEYRQNIHTLRQTLTENFEVLEFESNPLNYNPDDLSIIHKIYEQDTDCVKSCDFMIGECSYPSLGLGYEIGLAIEKNKPLLAVAEPDKRVSRMILGITHPQFEFFRYENVERLLEKVDEFARKNGFLG